MRYFLLIIYICHYYSNKYTCYSIYYMQHIHCMQLYIYYITYSILILFLLYNSNKYSAIYIQYTYSYISSIYYIMYILHTFFGVLLYLLLLQSNHTLCLPRNLVWKHMALGIKVNPQARIPVPILYSNWILEKQLCFLYYQQTLHPNVEEWFLRAALLLACSVLTIPGQS